MAHVLVLDKTQGWLSSIWSTGGYLGRMLGTFQVVIRAEEWDPVYDQLAELKRIDSLQVWGHGNPGSVLIDRHHLDLELLEQAIASRLAPEAYTWFRSCAVFAGAEGRAFAIRAASTIGPTVAHTRIVSKPWPICQSGGHGIRPGELPRWPITEGFAEDGTLLGSNPMAPNTCSVLAMEPPPHWWRS